MKKRTIKLIILEIMLFSLINTMMPLASAAPVTKQVCQIGDLIEFGSYPQENEPILVSVRYGEDPEEVAKEAGIQLNWKSYGYFHGETDSDDFDHGGNMKPSDFMKYADFEYNGEKYRAVKFDHYRPEITGHEFNDNQDSQTESHYYNSVYETGDIYYFRYEPLFWRVLDPETGLIVCDTIIDSQPFQNYYIVETANEFNPNDYEGLEDWDFNYEVTNIYGNAEKTRLATDYSSSSIRTWLNQDFYQTAFSEDDCSRIQQTTLHVKDSSTDENTKISDNVFLLAANDKQIEFSQHTELLSKQLVRNDPTTGYTQTLPVLSRFCSDYARCQGVRTDGFTICEEELLRTGCWTLHNNGYFDPLGVVGQTSYGIRPALCLKDIAGNKNVTNVQIGDKITARGKLSDKKNEYVLTLDEPITYRVCDEEDDCFGAMFTICSFYLNNNEVDFSESLGESLEVTGTFTVKYTDEKVFHVSEDRVDQFSLTDCSVTRVSNNTTETASTNLEDKREDEQAYQKAESHSGPYIIIAVCAAVMLSVAIGAVVVSKKKKKKKEL